MLQPRPLPQQRLELHRRLHQNSRQVRPPRPERLPSPRPLPRQAQLPSPRCLPMPQALPRRLLQQPLWRMWQRRQPLRLPEQKLRAQVLSQSLRRLKARRTWRQAALRPRRVRRRSPPPRRPTTPGGTAERQSLGRRRRRRRRTTSQTFPVRRNFGLRATTSSRPGSCTTRGRPTPRRSTSCPWGRRRSGPSCIATGLPACRSFQGGTRSSVTAKRRST
mmetsp:Transcript_70759/g.210991  ORF Transcript_70759/g.210991 Transcript_70759/m.210991 type:complete len:219 (+) Transcript_70759:395-1051(+)